MTDALPESREDKLARMRAASQRKQAAETEYADLKAEVLPDLAGEGQVYFVDEDGKKRYATEVEPDIAVVDLDWAAENLPADVYALIVKPPQADLKGVEYAEKMGLLSPEQLTRLVSYVKGTKRVYISDPVH